MDYSRIRHNLLVGTCPETVSDIDELKKAGVTAVLNLQTDADLSEWCPNWQQLEARYQALGVRLCRVPIRDFHPASLRDHLPRAVRVLADLLRQGQTVYLHCNSGIGRSPSTAIAYLRWVEGLPLEEAANEVTSRRPCNPDLDTIRQATKDWQKEHL